MDQLPMSKDCIVCGRENPVGLRLRFESSAEGVTARVRPQTHFQGFAGLLHGGMVAGLLDDAMWWAVYASHRMVTMTVEISVRYRRPVPVDETIQVTGQITEVRHNRLFLTEGRILNAANETLAEANAKFLVAPADLIPVLLRDLQP